MADQSNNARGKESSSTNLLPGSDCVRVLIFDDPDIPQASPLITLNKVLDLLSLCIAAIFLLYVTGKWIAPFIIKQIITPILKRQATALTPPTLAVALTTSLALSPVLLVPSGPSMWLSGLFFGYKAGFIIIMIGTTIGMILPFMIARKFPKSINRVVRRWADERGYVRMGKGRWFDEFRMVALCRLAPLNYAVVSYSAGVSSMGLWAYICGSVCVMMPEAYLYLFSGKVMKICAELKIYWSQNGSEAVIFVVSAGCALGLYLCFLLSEKRALKELEEIRKDRVVLLDKKGLIF